MMDPRQTAFEKLAEDDFDLLIVGGGINGAGAARDAALRGLKVAVVEQHDWATGTSSRSSKLVHGGFRYLQTYQFGLVHESTTERAVQLNVAPHLVRPMPFMLASYKGDRYGLYTINMGLWLYDILALFRVPRRHRMYWHKRTLGLQPGLRTEGLRGSLTYFDAATDDARLTLENVLDAQAHGAVTLNYAKVTALTQSEGGRVTGATVSDQLSGRSATVRAKLVINTTGPWTDQLLGLDPDRHPDARLLRRTKGAHLVVPAERLPLNFAMGMVQPTDGRSLFAIPWGPHVYLGTTDIDSDDDPASVYAAVEDRDQILETVNHYFPDVGLGPTDVVGTWCGLRPLVAPNDETTTGKTSREHLILEEPAGLMTMTGGKLTTYRLMSRELVNRAVKSLHRAKLLDRKVGASTTKKAPLPGAQGLGGAAGLPSLAEELAQQTGVTPALGQHLAGTYGVRARELLASSGGGAELDPICAPWPVCWAELDYAVGAEQARSLLDFFARRTQLLIRHPEDSLPCLEAVAARMGDQLAWDPDQRAAQIAAVQQEIGRSLACVR